MGGEPSDAGIFGCHSDNAKLFERIVHSGIRYVIKCKQTNAAAT